MSRQVMRETNWLKAPLKPLRTSYLEEIRHELGSYTEMSVVLHDCGEKDTGVVMSQGMFRRYGAECIGTFAYVFLDAA